MPTTHTEVTEPTLTSTTAVETPAAPVLKGTVFHAPKDSDDTLVPQAAAIINILRAAGGSLSKKALVEAIGTTVKTKQPPGRVLSFYKGKLEKTGFLTTTKH